MKNSPLIDTSSLQYAPWQAFLVLTTPNPQVASDAYRPEVWASESPKTFVEDDQGKLWYFDAIVRLDHSQSQRITQHPVQTGANITDHSFALPAQLTMEIGMSDVMDSYEPGQWGSDGSEPTKSVQAYQVLKMWKTYGTPLTITTRLDTYENMVVAHLSTPDDIKTKHGLKCMASFQQIFTASIEKQKTSLIPSATDQTGIGTKAVIPANESAPLAIKNLVTGR